MSSNIISNEITYQSNGDNFTGYFAYDDNISGERPGVLIVHDIWGYGDYVKTRADQLAELGYAAFALDMYGTGKASQNPPEAQGLMMELNKNLDLMRERFNAAQDVLKSQTQTDASKIAATGYCFGGRVVLGMARAGLDLAAVLSFHGILKTPVAMPKNAFSGKIAVYTGEADPMVPAEDIDNFNQEMTAAEANYFIKSYPGVLHGFTNPESTARGEKAGTPLRYDAAADADSFEGMQDVLVSVFK